MKPIQLKLQAFGPFAEATIIDFQKLSMGGLFLIHGQTGSGKTSILDGICFALFGTSSGADRSSEGLRSDLANDTIPTEVIFEFSMGPTLYRVIRRPRQTLKRQRGEGLTTQQPKGELWKLQHNTWALESSGDKKTDLRISELIGMSEEQFRQVVILPQGQFRKFLAASSEAREELLEKLFRTAKYRHLAEHLSTKAAAVSSEVSNQKQLLNAQFASLNISTREEFKNLHSATTAKIQELESKVTHLDSITEEKRLRLEQAQKFNLNSISFSNLKTQESKVNERADEIHAVKAKLADHRRSRPVLQIDALVLQHEQDLKRLEIKIRDSQEMLLETKKSLAAAEALKLATENRVSEIDALKSENQLLREIWTAANRLKAEEAAFANLEKTLTLDRAKLANLEATRVALQAEISTRAEMLNSLSEVAKMLIPSNEERRRLAIETDSLKKDRAELIEAEENIIEANNLHLKHQASFLEVQSSTTELKIHFHLSQAALLAMDLKPHQPCPVCGNTSHPSPAKTGSHQPTANQIKEAELKLEEVTLSFSAARERALGAQNAAVKARERAVLKVGENQNLIPSLSSLIETKLQQKDQLEHKIAQCQQASESVTKLLKVKEQSDLKFTKLENEILELKTQEEKNSLAIEAQRGKLSELFHQVPPERRDLAAITARGQLIANQIQAFTNELNEKRQSFELEYQKHNTIQGHLESLKNEADQKSSELQIQLNHRTVALTKAGFSEISACRLAGLSESVFSDLESQAKQFDEDKAVVTAKLDDLKNTLAGAPEWARDLKLRTEEFNHAESDRAENRALFLSIKDRRTQLIGANERIDRLSDTIASLEEKYAVLGRLAGVANGQPPYNLSRVNFARFVLASRLDDVLDLASRRLLKMSRGQFTLKRTLLSVDRRKTSGLDLEVEDSQTGTTRPTSSLSGGEGFMASLCLALGLADVVQNELGGVRLDAIFVDEGFGSLDAEALELAMKTLAELQAGGRIVGVISHVPELKEQIAKRLFVRKSIVGSQTEWDCSI